MFGVVKVKRPVFEPAQTHMHLFPSLTLLKLKCRIEGLTVIDK